MNPIYGNMREKKGGESHQFTQQNPAYDVGASDILRRRHLLDVIFTEKRPERNSRPIG